MWLDVSDVHKLLRFCFLIFYEIIERSSLSGTLKFSAASSLPPPVLHSGETGENVAECPVSSPNVRSGEEQLSGHFPSFDL